MRDRADREHVLAILASIADAATQTLSEALYDAFQEIEPAEIRQMRIDRGEYLLQTGRASVNETAAEKYAAGLLDGLSRAMNDDEMDLTDLKKSIRGNEVRILSDLILENKAEDLEAFAHTCNVRLDVLSFFAVYFARPYRKEAAARLTRDVDLSRWPRGFCPVCGHAPCFCRLAGRAGRRILWCHACTTLWNFDRLRCPFCLNDDHDKLTYYTVDDDETYRIDVCDHCRRYLKTGRTHEMALDKTEESTDIEHDYLLTAHLDYIAAREGYIRESVLGACFESAHGQEARA